MSKIGILLPRSTYYETIGFDMHEGLRSGLKKMGREDIKVITDNIGFGADKTSVYRSAERLLLEEDVSIVFAYITPRTAQLLRPLFMATNKVLIVLDAGSCLPQEWPATPNILYHSLHNCLGAWLSGKLAAENHSEGGLVTGYYDGGYLHTAAMTSGFQQNGGTITYNHATGYTAQDFTMVPLQELRADKPDSCLLTLFSGDFNQWFFRDIKQVYPNQQTPIYLTPFGFEEMMLSESQYPGDNALGYASWSKSIENEENKTFCATLIDKGKTPNLFSLMGWEAASLAILALDAFDACKNNGRDAATLLKSKRFSSPRGTIWFHEESNTSLAPMYKSSIDNNGDGYCKLIILEENQDVELTFNQMFNIELDGAISGWFNSYTCN